MTTRTEVAADSPLIYYYLDESTGNPTNYGSSGGTGTATGTITRSQTGAGAATGTSWRLNPASVVTNISKATVVSGTAWTFETWVKRATAGSDWVRILANLRTGGDPNNYWEVAIVDEAPDTGTLRLYDSAGGSATFKLAALSDLNWHHIAVTYNAGTVKLYADGALLNSTSMTVASRSGTFYVGDTRVVGRDSYVDEPAFFTTALSDARVAAHAGVVNKKVTVTPAGLSIANPNVAAKTGTKAQAPASAVSVIAPAPNVTIDYFHPVSLVNADKWNNGGTWSATGDLTFDAFLKSPAFNIPEGYEIATAELVLYKISSSNPAITVSRVTQSWTESDQIVPTITTAGQTSKAIGAGAGSVSFDITAIAKAWATNPNYGLKVTPGTGSATFASRENATVANRPYMRATLQEIVYGPEVRTIAPAVGLAMAAPAPTVRTARQVSVLAPVATAAVLVNAPTVLTTTEPDYTSRPDHVAMSIVAPAPSQRVEVLVRVQAAPVVVSLATQPATVNLTTNRLNKTSPATLSMRAVGIYSKENDRYYKALPATMDFDDVWYQMEEQSGTVAIDSEIGGQTKFTQNGVYYGGTTFRVEGPQLRKAVRFDGINDYLWVAGVNKGYGDQSGSQAVVRPDMSATVELSVRTSQANGTLWAGGAYAAQSTNAVEVRLVNGEMVFYRRGAQVVRVRKNIADGQWHHIIVSVPTINDPAANEFYVMIDGQREFVHKGMDIAAVDVMPVTMMAMSTAPVAGGDPTNVRNFLAGDLRDLIVRLSSVLSADAAQRLYYEWSDSFIASVPAALVNLSAVDAFKAKGNTKRMILLYGLPWDYEIVGNTAHELFNYFSNLGGFVIETFSGYINTATGKRDYDNFMAAHPELGAFGGQLYFEPRPFRLEDYLVYPVSIRGDMPANFGPRSAPGMLKSDVSVDIDGSLVDDRTGLPRWINLQEDLVEPIENFDAITAVNYPWTKPNDGSFNLNRPSSEVIGNKDYGQGRNGAHPVQRAYGLTDFQWTQARDKFRDSIMEAAYNGVNLWITEHYMALHLGFVQAVDIHSVGYFSNPEAASYPSTTVGQYHGYNLKAEALDKAHLTIGQTPYSWVGSTGDYYSTPQVNDYRRIVALENGLTDIPSNEYGSRVLRWSYDEYLPNGLAEAYDIVKRPNGLQIGDLTKMSVLEWKPGKPQEFHKQFQRFEIISAKPEGVAGKIIAREMLSYDGPNGATYENPYRNNAITIAAEAGTIVRGRAIRGRAFMDFMDTDLSQTHIQEDVNRGEWAGVPNRNVSTWDFDTRRRYETTITIVEKVAFFFNDNTGGFEQKRVESRYNIYTSNETRNLTYLSMHIRGLAWLAKSTTVDAGSTKVFAAPTELSLVTQPIKASFTRNVSSSVKPATLFLEARNLANFRGPNVSNKAFPALMSLEVRGLGKVTKVSPIELSLVAVDAVANTNGERIVVFIDNDRTITLFLKEDN